ncbi:corticotropin-releasing factor receptor 1-like isoform X2 [Panulirus ornatus]|uniref:corticotropin-releasing factor receptor 1-like isoform X2 n=1 Tax=Panulirus ornatus TaxID=150431 RepID=UPI003A864344
MATDMTTLYVEEEVGTAMTPAGRDDQYFQLPPEGQKCLEDFWDSLPLDGVYCNATWDTLYCWPATRAGRRVSQSCATVFSEVPDLRNYPHALAYRECDRSGTWLWEGWTNYSQCLSVIEQQGGSSGVVEAVRYITFVGGLLSLLTLTITLFIFTYYRTLECDRLRVHRNLVLALIIRFLVMLVLTEPFVSNRQTRTYRDVDWLCKSLLALRMYAQMASINWMFVEGLFLHSRLTSNVFDSGAPFTLYYTIGWGAPLVFILAWATTMSLHYPVHCWRSYGSLSYVWILVAPMVAALMINLLFLINIIRILVTKLRAGDAVRTRQVSAPSQRPLLQRHNRHKVLHAHQHTHHHPQQQQTAHKPKNSSSDTECHQEQQHPQTTTLNTHLKVNSSYGENDPEWDSLSCPTDTESNSHRRSRDFSPLLHCRRDENSIATQECPHPHLASRRQIYSKLQHYPTVGYAANRPEFNIRKAIRATVVLFPLLGITNLLFAVNPGDNGHLEGAYMLTNAILQSSQGVIVSVLYCFLNSEVRDLLRKRWRQYRLRRRGQPACRRRKSTKCTIILETSLSHRPSPDNTPRHSQVQGVDNHALETVV